MKSLIIFAIIVLVAYCQQNIDIDAVFKNERLLNNYLDCLLDRKPCTPNGKQLKDRIPMSLENNCKECTPAQRQSIERAIGLLIKNRPNTWRDLRKKYDPNNKYVERYKNIINNFSKE